MNKLMMIKQRYFYGISVKLFLIAKISICILLLLSFMPNITVVSFLGIEVNLISIISICFIVVLSYCYNKMLSKPLIQINEAVAKIANLDFNTSLAIDSKDELGELSSNLNILANKLNTTIKQLENELSKNIDLLIQQKELTDDLSHEIKTPLSIITAYSQAIQDNINPELNKMYLSTITKEAAKINNLLVDLLNISAYQSGSVTIKKETFNLVALVERIAGKILVDHSQKDLKITCDFPNDEILIEADKSLIEKALKNLVLNAYQYVDGRGLIKIGIKKQLNKVTFYLFNSCEHLTNEQLIKIWKRFYRVDKSRSKYTGGSGLGLATVQHIFKLHSFEFGARNNQSGIEFWVEI